MPDRRLNFGDPADAGTRWAMEDAANAAGGGNFVIARDLDGSGVLLRYNPTSGNFEYFADVDLGGRDIQNGSTTVFDGATDTVGDGTTSADHQSVNTGKAVIGEGAAAVGPSMSDSEIRSAIESAGVGGTIFWAAGDYAASTTTTVDTDTDAFYPHLDGQTSYPIGQINITLDGDFDTTSEWVAVFAGADPANGNSEITIKGPIEIDGNKSNVDASGKQWDLINFKNVNDFEIEGVTIRNSPADSFDFDDCEDGIVRNCRSFDAVAKAFHPSTGCENIKVENSVSYRAGTEGFSNVTGAVGTVFDGCVSIADNIGYRIDAPGAKGDELLLEGCYCYVPVEHALATVQSAGSCTIDGGHFGRITTASDSSQHLVDFGDVSNAQYSVKGATFASGGSAGQQLLNNLPSNSTVQGCTFHSGNVTTVVCENGGSDITFKDNKVTIASVTPIEANNATVDVRGNTFDTDVSDLITGLGGGYVRDNTPTIPVDVTNLTAEAGNEAWNDGTIGSVGPYVYDGTDWVGYGPASGGTI